MDASLYNSYSDTVENKVCVLIDLFKEYLCIIILCVWWFSGSAVLLQTIVTKFCILTILYTNIYLLSIGQNRVKFKTEWNDFHPRKWFELLPFVKCEPFLGPPWFRCLSAPQLLAGRNRSFSSSGIHWQCQWRRYTLWLALIRARGSGPCHSRVFIHNSN